MKVNYKQIFKDIIRYKFPEKESVCEKILCKSELDSFDITLLNTLIFGKKIRSNGKISNSEYKSYDKRTIKNVLTYQINHNLSNIETAKKFNVSRNTISSWKTNLTKITVD